MEAGITAMRNIAKRFQQNFPNILTQNYTSENFVFRHTRTEYTNVTIRAFASGLFGEAGSQNVIYEDIPAVDWFLSPSDFCPAFSDEISNASAERVAFEMGPEMEQLKEQVNRRLGFRASNRLTHDQVFNMWYFCRHQLAFETLNSETGQNCE